MHRLFFLLSCLMLVEPLAAQSPLVWERRKDFSGGADGISSVVAVGNTAVTVGTADVPGGPDLEVVSYAPNGDERWTDSAPLIPGFTTGVFAAAAEGDNVFVAGYTNVPNDSDIFVRAYDARTAHLLWHDTFSKGRDDLPKAIAAGPSAIVVVGQGGNSLAPAFTSLKGIIRAYHPVTGRILWEDQIDAGNSVNTIAWAAFVTGSEVFVAASSSKTAEANDMIFRAYRASTGKLLWEVKGISVRPTSITARGDLVFVTGNDPSHAFIAAFNAKDGHKVWEDVFATGRFVDVAVESQLVVAVGSTGRGSLARAYDMSSGNLVWERIIAPPDFFGEFLSGVVLSKDVAYVVGASVGFRELAFLVRAYDLPSGSILFEDRSHLGRFTAGNDIVLGRSLVYAVGAVSDSGLPDFLIRAYDRDAFERN